ncbi:Stress-activated protein kinase JNK [Trichostrongylus colubriformis]|uniref:Stress-activated protein kinase JNK n=1 Tax=Trichostrongylus colubriformis TaxID=6319 RepID=A0AAN8ICB9_TRICO
MRNSIIQDPHSHSSCSFTIPKRYVNLKFLNAGAQGTVVEFNCDDIPLKREVDSVRTEEEAPSSVEHCSKRVFRLDHRTLSFFVYQMLCAIKHLHNSGVIHRDLKPSNIVVNDKCVLKVLDFGLARKKTIDTAMRMSDYVVTRYYRAPEVILGLPYSEKVDIWSVGCIFAEMINHRVLFPGLDRVDQWSKIINEMGTPGEDFIKQLGNSAAMYVRSLPPQVGKPIEEIAPDSNFLKETENVKANLTAEWGRDLLARMLVINPDNRFSVEESLNHPYVKVWFRDEEVNAPQSENRYNEEIDCADRSLSEWKELIYNEVKQFEAKHDIFGQA